MAKIIAIGTSNPERCLTQQESWDSLRHSRKLSPLENKYYKRFMLDEGIETRFAALDKIEDIFSENQDEIIARYQKAAPVIASEASTKALAIAGLNKIQADFLATASCTGYICPGLSSYIIEKSGLNADISAIDLQGMGCGAALPALSTAVGFLANTKKTSYALVNCTEICSAAVYWDDNLGLILSNSIFGDGSATVVMTNDEKASGPEILDYLVLNLPEKRESLRFKTKNGRLHNVLVAEVPEVASSSVKKMVDGLLQKHNLAKSDIKFWAIHSGGRKVLTTICDKLGLTEENMQYSNEVLKKYGNMSSPTVLFSLEKIIDSGLPKSGDYGMAIAFGAGFSCYAMLLRW